MSYILSIDQGTTSSRAIVYNKNFEVVGVGQLPLDQYFPQPGWVEHDLEQIWQSVCQAITHACQAASNKDPDFTREKIVCIGITNQRETFGLWEKSSGKPVGRAIVWQCRRSAELCLKLKNNSQAKKIAQQSGLVLDPYFSGTKLMWWLSKDSQIRARAKKGELAFGTIDTFLIWRLSGGRAHATDTTNASRTLLMDLKKCQWGEAALKLFKIPKSLLPEIKASNSEFAKTNGLEGVLPKGIPITGVLGDQQAALFGQSCFAPGEGKITYGTGAFFLINTGKNIKRSRAGLSTVAWTIGKQNIYALEGSVFIAGAAVQWLREGLKLIEHSHEIEALAQRVDSSDGVFFIPALSGLGAPYWAPHARGVLGGLTRGTQREHVARAVLEGITLSIGSSYSALCKDAKIKIKRVGVDGGASKNNLMMQFQANLLQTAIARPADVESTARGAAYMAALGAGLVKDLRELLKKHITEDTFKAQISKKEAQKLKEDWERRVAASLRF